MSACHGNVPEYFTKIMMVSRYLLPLFVVLLVGLLVFKEWRQGKTQEKEEISGVGKSAAVARSEISSVHADPVHSYRGNQEDRAKQQEVEKCLADATRLFQNRDFGGAITSLNRANEISGSSARVLNLRGSCYVELRDFEKALADFESASELAKGNSSIRFNVGEIHFVTRQWQQALDVFEKLKGQLPPEDTKLSRLVEFKVMLCQNRLGKMEEVEALASKYGEDDSSPFYWYAAALLAGQANDPQKQAALLAEASRRFPNPADLAPWKDTMIEYRE